MTPAARALLALSLACGPVLPACADTTSFTLSAATWQKVASAGQNVDVQNTAVAGTVTLSTASGGVPASLVGQALAPGEHRAYSLTADLYALGSGRILVTTGFGQQAGSTGTDYSVNPAAVPAAGLSLLQTIPATPARTAVEVQNQSAGTIQVVRDDGAGNNVTSILLAPGSGAGAQGGGWSSATFKGRVRVYGAAGAQVAAYQD